MADAPASGNGWGALEVILALVLAIGLISTITGNPIPSLAGPSAKPSPIKKVATQPGCGIIVSSPAHQEKIGSEVVLSGTVAQCLTNTVPDALTAHVVDSTGASLSAVTAVAVNRGFFGDATFSTSIPLVGVAHSIQAYVFVSGPIHADGSADTVRVPIQLIPADPAAPASAPTTFTTPSSTTNFYATPTPTPSYVTPTYTAPAPANTNSSPAPSGGNGITF